MYCRIFGNCAQGSDPNLFWNAADCIYAQEALLARGSTKRATALPKHLNRNKTRKIHCNLLRDFLLCSFNKHLHWFRCSGKGEHLNLAARQNTAAKPLTTNVLQNFQQQRPWFRSQVGFECRGMQMYSGGTSERGISERCNRTAQASEPTRKIHCNLLRDFLLCGFNKHLRWFRCSGKGEYLNPVLRQNPAVKPLTTSALQDFRRLCPWFRSQTGLEHRGMQMRPGGVSGKGVHQPRNRTAQASEPEKNPKNSLQLIERLSVVRFRQASPLVQMQRKSGVSEPCSKAESGSQSIHNKRIAGLSATVSMVQIPDGFGTPRNANAPWRCFWQGCPPTSQQNSPRI